jgi:hypothetical protein
MNYRSFLPVLLAAASAVCLSSCATPAKVTLDAKTDSILTAMCDKLAAAKTLRVHVSRAASPGIGSGITLAEKAAGTVAVQKPDKVAAELRTSEGARAIGFDGRTLTVVDRAAGTHAVVPAAGDIDHTVRAIQKTYGLTLPVSELISNNPKALLLEGVKSGTCTGSGTVNGVPCDRLDFTQEGLSWQLWVATGDKLPRRLSLAYSKGGGGAPRTVTADLTQWQTDIPLSGAELSVKPPAGSRALDMIPLE